MLTEVTPVFVNVAVLPTSGTVAGDQLPAVSKLAVAPIQVWAAALPAQRPAATATMPATPLSRLIGNPLPPVWLPRRTHFNGSLPLVQTENAAQSLQKGGQPTIS